MSRVALWLLTVAISLPKGFWKERVMPLFTDIHKLTAWIWGALTFLSADSLIACHEIGMLARTIVFICMVCELILTIVILNTNRSNLFRGITITILIMTNVVNYIWLAQIEKWGPLTINIVILMVGMFIASKTRSIKTLN